MEQFFSGPRVDLELFLQFVADAFQFFPGGRGHFAGHDDGRRFALQSKNNLAVFGLGFSFQIHYHYINYAEITIFLFNLY